MPIFTPWKNGRYETSPGLKPLGTDFGNGHWDNCVFILDETAPRRIAAKRESLKERESKYRQVHHLRTQVAEAAANVIQQRLALDAPHVDLPTRSTPIDRLDAYALHIPEDLAIVAVENGIDWLAYTHLCAPSHWSPEEKIGKSFTAVHQPVPGFEKTANVAQKMIETMTQRGPFVRFVWGMESDDRPNHHPVAPQGVDQDEWWGRRFSEEGRFLVRVERQCLIPLPSVNAALFTIRLFWWTMEEVRATPELRLPLLQALNGMSPQEQSYKGIAGRLPEIVHLLEPPNA